jgi:lipoate-protein ligase A
LITCDEARLATRHEAGLVPVVEPVTFDPVTNLDREARYLRAVETPSFRVWRSTDSIVLGRFLNAEDEVHLARAEELKVPVLQRPSGGGAVFHDLGNVNYSIYLPRGNVPASSIEEALRVLSFPVTELLDALGVSWSWMPPNNVYVLGNKISGSAQARSRSGLLHHGTLLVAANLEKMALLLKPGGRSILAPVVNLSDVVWNVTTEEAEALLIEIFMKQ